MCKPAYIRHQHADTRTRIAVVGIFSERGGFQRRLMNMIKVWSRLGVEVDLVLLRDSPTFYPEEMPSDVRTFSIASQRKWRNAFGLWRYLRQRRPDAVLSLRHIPNILSIRAASWPGAGSPPVFVNLPNSVTGSRRRRQRARREIKFRQIHSLYRRAAGIVVMTEAARHELTEDLGIAPEGIHVIPNAVITDQLYEKARQRASHPWLEEGASYRTVLAVGRLHRQKGFDTLIQAFARLKAGADLKLIIIGEGEARPKLEALVKDLGLNSRVDMPGFQNNPYPYIARADVFAMSSRWEGFGSVLVEAIALGVPSVATDCPAGPKEIIQKAQFGRLVPVDDVNAMVRALGEALNTGKASVREEVGALAEYDAESVARRYLKVMGHKFPPSE